MADPQAPAGTVPDPDDPETWAFSGSEDYSGTMPVLPNVAVDPETAAEGEAGLG